VGSQPTIDWAYIAGFLDGDGSLMLQLKRRSDSTRKWRFMCTICLYQDSRHEKPLKWIKKRFGIGYLSRRNDGMSELRVNGFQQVLRIMQFLKPYIKFKKVQANAFMQAASLLSRKSAGQLSERDLRKLVDLMLKIQSDNYATKNKKSRNELLKIVGLTL
jgi:hypothetical protein